MVRIDEHTVGRRGCKTYRVVTGEIARYLHDAGEGHTTWPLPGELRREAYFVWEQSADLREAAGSPTAMHSLDWDRGSECWAPHAPIEDVLASRGY